METPQKSQRVWIVLDCGSQRSYITEWLTEELSLTSRKEQSLTIMTFGSNGEQSRVCRIVKLGLFLKNGHTHPMTLFVVPLICEPLTCQPVSFCRDKFDNLEDHDLANPSDGSSRLDVDILIGSDLYW